MPWILNWTGWGGGLRECRPFWKKSDQQCREEKGTALFCFWLAKGRRIRSWAFFEHYYVSALYRWQYLHYLILTLKTPRARYQPRYINGEPEAQRGWEIGPGSQEIVNGRSEPGKQTCSLHCTTLCLFAMIWGCRRRQQWKLGDGGGGWAPALLPKPESLWEWKGRHWQSCRDNGSKAAAPAQQAGRSPDRAHDVGLPQWPPCRQAGLRTKTSSEGYTSFTDTDVHVQPAPGDSGQLWGRLYLYVHFVMGTRDEKYSVACPRSRAGEERTWALETRSTDSDVTCYLMR